MQSLVPELERRQHRRLRPTQPCELVVGANRHDGTIVEMSRGGLFVRTEARPASGQRIRVRFADRELHAVVVHAHAVPRSLGCLLPNGLGLRFVAPLGPGG
jgi:hypothetical protein